MRGRTLVTIFATTPLSAGGTQASIFLVLPSEINKQMKKTLVSACPARR